VTDRVWKKLKGWKEKSISQAGKEVLIKAVVQAIPNYVMSCYKLPDGCCDEIENMIARFWWGSQEGNRKIHWLSWERMSKSKNTGGMGFRNFNKALLGKQCWRLLTNENSLMARFFKSRYYSRSNFLDANLGFQPSYAWRSIMQAKEVVRMGARWRIGNGNKVRIWKDGWIPNNSDSFVKGPRVQLDENALVSELIDTNSKMWRREAVRSWFNPHEAKKILSIPLSHRLPEDKIIWGWEKNGEFSVRSAYHLLADKKNCNQPGPSSIYQESLWAKIWKAPIPNVIRNFLWRLVKHILPSRARLVKKRFRCGSLLSSLLSTD
jgi:hypothetical protein